MRKLILFITLLVSALVFAAENTPQQAGAQGTDEEALSPAEIEQTADTETGNDLILADVDDAEDAAEPASGNRRFIPTEQISQDLGVSFPIDI